MVDAPSDVKNTVLKFLVMLGVSYRQEQKEMLAALHNIPDRRNFNRISDDEIVDKLPEAATDIQRTKKDAFF